MAFDPENLMYVSKQYETDLIKRTEQYSADDSTYNTLLETNQMVDNILNQVNASYNEIANKIKEIKGEQNKWLVQVETSSFDAGASITDEFRQELEHVTGSANSDNRGMSNYKHVNFNNKDYEYKDSEQTNSPIANVIDVKNKTQLTANTEVPVFKIPLTDAEKLKILEFNISYIQQPHIVNPDNPDESVPSVKVMRYIKGKFFVIRPNPEQEPEKVIVKALIENADNTSNVKDVRTIDIKRDDSGEYIADMGPEYDFYFSITDRTTLNIALGNIVPYKYAICSEYMDTNDEIPEEITILKQDINEFTASAIYPLKNGAIKYIVRDDSSNSLWAVVGDTFESTQLKLINNIDYSVDMKIESVGSYTFIYGNNNSWIIPYGRTAEDAISIGGVKKALLLSTGEIIVNLNNEMISYFNTENYSVANTLARFDVPIDNIFQVSHDMAELPGTGVLIASAAEKSIKYSLLLPGSGTGLYKDSTFKSSSIDLDNESTTKFEASKATIVKTIDGIYIVGNFYSVTKNISKMWLCKKLTIRNSINYAFSETYPVNIWDIGNKESKALNFNVDKLVDTSIGIFIITDKKHLYTLVGPYTVKVHTLKGVFDQIGKFDDKDSYFYIEREKGKYFTSDESPLDKTIDVYENPQGIHVVTPYVIYELNKQRKIFEKFYVNRNIEQIVGAFVDETNKKTLISIKEGLKTHIAVQSHDVYLPNERIRHNYINLYSGTYLTKKEYMLMKDKDNYHENIHGPIIDFRCKLHVSFVDRVGSMYHPYLNAGDIISATSTKWSNVDPKVSRTVSFSNVGNRTVKSTKVRVRPNKYGFILYDNFDLVSQRGYDISTINNNRTYVIDHVGNNDGNFDIKKTRNEIGKLLRKSNKIFDSLESEDAKYVYNETGWPESGVIALHVATKAENKIETPYGYLSLTNNGDVVYTDKNGVSTTKNIANDLGDAKNIYYLNDLYRTIVAVFQNAIIVYNCRENEDDLSPFAPFELQSRIKRIDTTVINVKCYENVIYVEDRSTLSKLEITEDEIKLVELNSDNSKQIHDFVKINGSFFIIRGNANNYSISIINSSGNVISETPLSGAIAKLCHLNDELFIVTDLVVYRYILNKFVKYRDSTTSDIFKDMFYANEKYFVITKSIALGVLDIDNNYVMPVYLPDISQNSDISLKSVVYDVPKGYVVTFLLDNTEVSYLLVSKDWFREGPMTLMNQNTDILGMRETVTKNEGLIPEFAFGDSGFVVYKDYAVAIDNENTDKFVHKLFYRDKEVVSLNKTSTFAKDNNGEYVIDVEKSVFSEGSTLNNFESGAYYFYKYVETRESYSVAYVPEPNGATTRPNTGTQYFIKLGSDYNALPFPLMSWEDESCINQTVYVKNVETIDIMKPVNTEITIDPSRTYYKALNIAYRKATSTEKNDASIDKFSVSSTDGPFTLGFNTVDFCILGTKNVAGIAITKSNPSGNLETKVLLLTDSIINPDTIWNSAITSEVSFSKIVKVPTNLGNIEWLAQGFDNKLYLLNSNFAIVSSHDMAYTDVKFSNVGEILYVIADRNLLYFNTESNSLVEIVSNDYDFIDVIRYDSSLVMGITKTKTDNKYGIVSIANGTITPLVELADIVDFNCKAVGLRDHDIYLIGDGKCTNIYKITKRLDTYNVTIVTDVNRYLTKFDKIIPSNDKNIYISDEYDNTLYYLSTIDKLIKYENFGKVNEKCRYYANNVFFVEDWGWIEYGTLMKYPMGLIDIVNNTNLDPAYKETTISNDNINFDKSWYTDPFYSYFVTPFGKSLLSYQSAGQINEEHSTELSALKFAQCNSILISIPNDPNGYFYLPKKSSKLFNKIDGQKILPIKIDATSLLSDDCPIDLKTLSPTNNKYIGYGPNGEVLASVLDFDNIYPTTKGFTFATKENDVFVRRSNTTFTLVLTTTDVKEPGNTKMFSKIIECSAGIFYVSRQSVYKFDEDKEKFDAIDWPETVLTTKEINFAENMLDTIVIGRINKRLCNNGGRADGTYLEWGLYVYSLKLKRFIDPLIANSITKEYNPLYITCITQTSAGLFVVGCKRNKENSNIGAISDFDWSKGDHMSYVYRIWKPSLGEDVKAVKVNFRSYDNSENSEIFPILSQISEIKAWKDISTADKTSDTDLIILHNNPYYIHSQMNPMSEDPSVFNKTKCMLWYYDKNVLDNDGMPVFKPYWDPKNDFQYGVTVDIDGRNSIAPISDFSFDIKTIEGVTYLIRNEHSIEYPWCGKDLQLPYFGDVIDRWTSITYGGIARRRYQFQGMRDITRFFQEIESPTGSSNLDYSNETPLKSSRYFFDTLNTDKLPYKNANQRFTLNNTYHKIVHTDNGRVFDFVYFIESINNKNYGCVEVYERGEANLKHTWTLLPGSKVRDVNSPIKLATTPIATGFYYDRIKDFDVIDYNDVLFFKMFDGSIYRYGNYELIAVKDDSMTNVTKEVLYRLKTVISSSSPSTGGTQITGNTLADKLVVKEIGTVNPNSLIDDDNSTPDETSQRKLHVTQYVESTRSAHINGKYIGRNDRNLKSISNIVKYLFGNHRGSANMIAKDQYNLQSIKDLTHVHSNEILGNIDKLGVENAKIELEIYPGRAEHIKE